MIAPWANAHRQPASYIIRKATAADASALAGLRVAFLREVGAVSEGMLAAKVFYANQKEYAARLPIGEMIAWVAESQGEIVGASSLILFPNLASTSRCEELEGYLYSIYTTPEWRSCGIGSQLLEETINYTRASRAHRLYLHATSAGLPIYKKAGFVPIKRVRRAFALTEMELIL